MKQILALSLLCSIISICICAGSEQNDDVISLGDSRDSDVISSLLPNSQDSTYFLAFPVDDANSNNDQPEAIQPAGATSDKVSSSSDESKDEVMTITVNAGDDENDVKPDIVFPVQSVEPKQEPKFFPPSPFPFPFKPKLERKFPFPSPFGKFRPKFLPPVRNILQTLRRDESPLKLSPMDIFGAASFLKRMLGSKLRTLTNKYQHPIIEEKIASMVSPRILPRDPLPPPPPPIFLPFPILESTFPSPFSPLHPLLLLSSLASSIHSPLLPPFAHPFPFPPSSIHSPLLPPFAHQFPFPPQHFFPPPTPFFHPLPPLPPPIFHPMPFYRELPPPPPIYSRPSFPFPPPLHYLPLPSPQPPISDNMMFPNQPIAQELQNLPQTVTKDTDDEEIIFIPSNNEDVSPFGRSEEPTYVLLYPNQQEAIQNDIKPTAKRTLMDLLHPKPNNIRHVFQQTQILTQFKPDFFMEKPELSSYHKPIFRIIEN